MFSPKKFATKQHCRVYEAHFKQCITGEDLEFIESYLDYSNSQNQQKKIYLNIEVLYKNEINLAEIESITTAEIKELMISKSFPTRFLELAQPFALLLISIFLRKHVMNS